MYSQEAAFSRGRADLGAKVTVKKSKQGIKELIQASCR